MPGGRLAHEDRRRIASGLAEGLGYAEIARTLGRPTSTVSREVARNGGPDGYRADRAHQATGRRARRRAPLPPAEPPPTDAYGRDPDVVRAFVDRFAELMVHTGLSRMAARVLACLITTDSGSLTATELVGRLRVSPASVSKAVGFLEGMALLRRDRDGRRRERYVIDDDVWLRAWSADTHKHESVAATAREGAGILGAATPAGGRLDQMGRFFARLSEDMAAGPDPHVVEDVWTVLAALVHAGTPRTTDQLATALGWPADRVTTALTDSERHPDLAGPVALQHTGTAYTIIARPGRLTATQQAALHPASGDGVEQV